MDAAWSAAQGRYLLASLIGNEEASKNIPYGREMLPTALYTYIYTLYPNGERVSELYTKRVTSALLQ